MARKDDSNLLSRVTMVLARVDDPKAPKLPASLAADIKAFRAGVGPFVTASAKAAAALGLRDGALGKVGDADAVPPRKPRRLPMGSRRLVGMDRWAGCRTSG